MKKFKLHLFSGALTGCLLLFFACSDSTSSQNAWHLIPQEVQACLEVPNAENAWTYFGEKSRKKALKQNPEFKAFYASASIIDSIWKDEGGLKTLLSETGLLVAYTKEFGVMAVANNIENGQKFSSHLLETFRKDSRFELSNHWVDGKEVFHVWDAKGNDSLCFYSEEKLFLLSTNALLLDKALQGQEQASTWAGISSGNQKTHLYLKASALSPFLPFAPNSDEILCLETAFLEEMMMFTGVNTMYDGLQKTPPSNSKLPIGELAPNLSTRTIALKRKEKKAIAWLKLPSGKIEQVSYHKNASEGALLHAGLYIEGTEQALKTLKSDWADNNVWTKSPHLLPVIEQHLLQGETGMYVEPFHLPELEKKNELSIFQELFGKTGKVSINFSPAGANKTYTGIVVDFEKRPIVLHRELEVVDIDAIEPIQTDSLKPIALLDSITLPKSIDGIPVKFKHPLISEPVMVYNHHSKQQEILVQDSKYNLHLVSPKGEIRWSYALGGPIVDVVQEVDLYKNGKRQYMVATSKKLHCIDRLGKAVEGYPFGLTKDIHHFSVIDYDGSKNYRIALSDISGRLFLCDKKGKALNGWKPKTLNGNLLTSIQHCRVGKKDVIIAVEESGKVHLFKRNGSPYSGFPLKLNLALKGEVIVKDKKSFNSSYLQVITENNTIIEVDFKGNKRVVNERLASSPKPTNVRVEDGQLILPKL